MTVFEHPTAVRTGPPAPEGTALHHVPRPAPNPSPHATLSAIFSAPIRLYRHAIIDNLLILRRDGLRGLLRQRGWKFVAAVVTYYLVRDILLYVVIPFIVARRIL